jgi:hypothetical protein
MGKDGGSWLNVTSPIDMFKILDAWIFSALYRLSSSYNLGRYLASYRCIRCHDLSNLLFIICCLFKSLASQERRSNHRRLEALREVLVSLITRDWSSGHPIDQRL